MTAAPGKDPRVLLAGANQRSTLGVARSLSAHGVSFVVAGPRRRSMVGCSRFVRPHVAEPAPDPITDQENYVQFLLDVVLRSGIELVVPLTDSTLSACEVHRGAIEEHARLAAAPSSAVRNVLDKRANLELARRLGVPCPDQFELNGLDQIPALIAEIGFPLVLKRASKLRGEPDPAPEFSWLVVHDEAELRGSLKRYFPTGEFPIVQRQVTGAVQNVCCFAVAGAVVAAHQYASLRRLRSQGVFREITPLSTDLLAYAQALLQELRWEGVAHVGFFVGDDGDVRYMETNGRFWASTAGSVAAGWDFPYWTYEYFGLGRTPETPQSSLGHRRRSCWHYGDLQHLVHFLAGEEVQSGAGRTRLRAVADYLSAFRPSVDSDVFRLDDPLPELVEHSRALRGATRRFRRGLARRVFPRLRGVGPPTRRA